MPEKDKLSSYLLELKSFISSHHPSNDVYFEEILQNTGYRVNLILCMILATPFLIPIDIPGSSIILGILIVFIGLSLVFNKLLMPKRILRYKFKKDTVLKTLDRTIGVFNKFEKIFKPRAQFLTSSHRILKINHVLIIYSTIFLILPLPVPLTDSLPGYSIFLISAGILERDGYFILISYVLIAITTIYFAFIFILGYKFVLIILSHLGMNF